MLARRYNRTEKELSFKRQLPSALYARLDTMITRDKAQLLWSTRQRFSVDGPLIDAVAHLHSYVASTDGPWDVPLGMIIPRMPHFWSRGDASLLGGGAYCPGLRFWFDVTWSPRVTYAAHLVKPGSPGAVHINSLEFIVVILQFAAVATRLQTATAQDCLIYFPGGRPDIPVWLGETDNTVAQSWENRATSRSLQGQGLLSVYSELLRTNFIHTHCDHLAGVLNKVADDISRADFSLPLVTRWAQLFRKHPSLESLDYFQPSPALLQLLTSQLFSEHSPGPCVLPTVLGQFVPAGCTTSGSVSI
jgi:hypothetical protein